MWLQMTFIGKPQTRAGLLMTIVLVIFAVNTIVYRATAYRTNNLQKTFTNTFSWMLRWDFDWNFTGSLFSWAQLTISQHWLIMVWHRTGNEPLYKLNSMMSYFTDAYMPQWVELKYWHFSKLSPDFVGHFELRHVVTKRWSEIITASETRRELCLIL